MSVTDGCRLPARITERLRLPLIAAPMFLVSGPQLVAAACEAGVIGSFPTANCRDPVLLDAWLTQIRERLHRASDSGATPSAPICPNLIVHRSNPRLAADLAVLIKHRVEIVITSVGSPEAVVPPLHDLGALVLADVASMRHAEKALAAGVDGLVLLSAGAGGQTGWANPFAFVRAVRTIYDGPIVLAGGIADGVALRAAITLGCDLAYMGTRFIATAESMAAPAYKQMLVDSTLDDIVLTSAMTGLPTNIMRASILAAGLDPDSLPARGPIDVARDLQVAARPAGDDKPAKRWRSIWSAGHSVSGVLRQTSVAALIEHTEREYLAAAR